MDSTSGRLRIGACLSLSGRFAPFGRQAVRGLEVWAKLDGSADLLIEDDASDVRQLQALLPGVAAHTSPPSPTSAGEVPLDGRYRVSRTTP